MGSNANACSRLLALALAVAVAVAAAFVSVRSDMPMPGILAQPSLGHRTSRARVGMMSCHSSKQRAGRRNILALPIAGSFGLLSAQSSYARRSAPLPGQGNKKSLARTKIPREDFTEGPRGLLYYDIETGGGGEVKEGQRIAIHYSLKWKGITISTSRQGAGVTGGNPYGFDVGEQPGDPGSAFIKGLDLAVLGMQVGGVRRVIVPPELAYGNRQVQEISPNSELMIDIELLSIKTSTILGLNKSVRI
mmetsp:Transcript_2511/g.4639  ORF Transcript_2511/g.4639 Transcript_2511/m.4639 type:complete len:248 (-) Transcript_2511:183-926(-)